MMNVSCWTIYIGSWMLNAKSKMLNTEYHIVDFNKTSVSGAVIPIVMLLFFFNQVILILKVTHMGDTKSL